MRSKTSRNRQRRPLQATRRGKRSKDSKWWTRVASRLGQVDTAVASSSRLHCLQFNACSISKNLVEIKSRIFEESPDLILVQEDWIMSDTVSFSIPGYTWIHKARSQARQANGTLNSGGGVSILVRCNNFLKAEFLPDVDLSPDTTTESIRLRLHWTNPGGLSVLDIINVYKPPISSSSKDIRVDNFDPTSFDLAVNDVAARFDDSFATAGTAVLFAGDFNAHHSLWDYQSKADKHGRALAKFFESDFTIANDGNPTYHAKESKSAIDITAFKGQIVIEGWHHSQPIGLSHHDVLVFDIVALEAEPLTLHALDDSPDSIKYSGIAWGKVDYSKFNSIVEKIRDQHETLNDIPSDPRHQVHFLSKALQTGFD